MNQRAITSESQPTHDQGVEELEGQRGQRRSFISHISALRETQHVTVTQGNVWN